MIFSWLRASGRGVVIGGDNHGVVVTGVVKGDVVVVNGERYKFSLHIPWGSDPIPGNVGSLLTWHSRIPRKLYGREAELGALRRWASDRAPILVRIIHGEGGAGKTRLAFELADELRKEGWEAGQVADLAKPIVFPMRKQGARVLLIIDYPERFPREVAALLELIRNSELPGLHLRVLLLCRNVQVMGELVNERVPYASPPIELRPLAGKEDSAWELFKNGWEEMARLHKLARSLPLSETAFNTWARGSPTHAQPLIILAFALNLVHDPTATQLGRKEILHRLVQRERHRLAREVEKYQIQEQGALLLKALAAIPGSLSAQDVDSLHARLTHPGITLPTAVALKRTTLWQDGRLQELQPDLLASVLLHEVTEIWLSDFAAVGVWAWAFLTVGSPPPSELRSRLSRLARLAADRPRSDAGEAAANLLVDALARLVEADDDGAGIIDAVLNQTAQLEFTLASLALAAARAVVRAQERRTEEDFSRHAPELARRLNNLSVRLGKTGDRPGALVAIRHAVEIRESLARENFAAHAPDLAMSLNNLSVDLGGSGDHVGGLAAIRRAVEIYEALVKENFAAHALGLAMSLHNLSVDLAETGDRAGGLTEVRRAVEIYEALAKENFAAHAQDLATSLHNLSHRLGESGDSAGALVAIRRALEIREALAKENFAAHAPDLAAELNTLSVWLAETVDPAGGLAAIRRAVEIYEVLAKENFAAHGPDLANSLDTLSDRLAETGDRAGGLAAIRRAVEIYQVLTKESVAAHAQGLAMGLSTLSKRLAETGDRTEGLAASRQAVEIREALAKENFAAYAPDLAESLNNLSLRLAEVGDRAGGMAAIRRAVEILRPVATDFPARYARDLERCLALLSRLQDGE